MMKRLLALLLALMLVPLCAMAEPHVINLVKNPDAPWQFQQGAPILEVIFPPIKGADACILRVGDEVMMVDAATPGQRARVAAALEYMGIDRIHTAFNTHPHDDHVGGFPFVHEIAPIGRFFITFPKDHNRNMKAAVHDLGALGIPIESAKNGDVFRLGPAELTVMQRTTGWFSDNNKSAMLMVRHGERSILLAADVELDAQNEMLKTIPDELKADILKYPHHGVAKAGWNFLKHVGAEMAVITNSRYSVKNTRKDAEKRKLPLVYTADGMVRLRTDGMVRLRTDGVIWVVDQIVLDVE